MEKIHQKINSGYGSFFNGSDVNNWIDSHNGNGFNITFTGNRATTEIVNGVVASTVKTYATFLI